MKEKTQLPVFFDIINYSTEEIIIDLLNQPIKDGLSIISSFTDDTDFEASLVRFKSDIDVFDSVCSLLKFTKKKETKYAELNKYLSCVKPTLSR